MKYAPNRAGGYAHQHAIQAYRRHGASVNGHDRERPFSGDGTALGFHYRNGLVEAGMDYHAAGDLVECLERAQRCRWNASRIARGY